MRISVLVLLLFGLGGTTRLQARLTWHETTQTLVADPSQSEVTAIFTFANGSRHSITIAEVVTSCGCTSARFDRKTYAPGEAGKVEVTLHYGLEADQLEESVTIATNEPGERDTLRVKATVPGARKKFERIEVTPSLVEWPRGSNASPKVITLRLALSDDAIRPTAARADDKAFEVALRQPEPTNPQLYELIITPRRTDEPREAAITIMTNSRSFRPEWAPEITYRVIAAIK